MLSLNSSQLEWLLRPYQHYVMGRKGGRPCRHAWLVCLSERYHGDRKPVLWNRVYYGEGEGGGGCFKMGKLRV